MTPPSVTKSHNPISKNCWCGCIVLLLMILSGCTPMQQFRLIPSEDNQLQSEAEQLFINGDFDSAKQRFEQLYKNSLSDRQRNLALYGLACSQIMLAEDDGHLVEGIHNLIRWDAEKGGTVFYENHHLLILALSQQEKRLLTQQKTRSANDKKQNQKISQQQKTISELGGTLVKLQKQLKELEALDEHYQEQKRNQ